MIDESLNLPNKVEDIYGNSYNVDIAIVLVDEIPPEINLEYNKSVST